MTPAKFLSGKLHALEGGNVGIVAVNFSGR